MSLVIVKTIEELAVETAKIIYQSYILAIKKNGCFTFVLSGGNTPKFVFEELVKNFMNKIKWEKVYLFWLDERCVKPDHVDSNYKLAKEYLLSSIEFAAVYRMKGELDPHEAAVEYNDTILNHFDLKVGETPEFDLILLGMGEDGHCASLFPGTKELKEKNKVVISTDNIHYGYKRITLTLPSIRASNKVLMISSSVKLNVFRDRIKALPVHNINNENLRVVVKI